VGKTGSLNIWRRLAQRRTSGDDRATDSLGVWYEDTYLSLPRVCQASLVHAAVLSCKVPPHGQTHGVTLPRKVVSRRLSEAAQDRDDSVPADYYGCLVIRAMPWWSV
jgi:hypothetical protein